MNLERLNELVLQSLEHENRGVQVYETALRCAVNDDLRSEWKEYLDQTRKHVRVLQDVCHELELDPDRDSPGRDIVRDLGASLVEAMEKALDDGDPEAAQLTACECVVLAETKDHFDWELLGACASKQNGREARGMK